MSIKYNIVKRGRPDHAEVPKKYYPSLQSTGKVTMRELATEASNISTLSTADMMGAIEAFLTIIPRHLAEGKVVDLGDFGSFWLRFKAEGAEEPAKVRGNLITTLLPRFIPGKEFKRLLRAVKFERLH
ncbi:MAG TPA: HU family DNA-binding protein [Anaerolineales bacterium]|nr:HU family DNA-binding protein [Anaerolineales bacterium]